jgi:nucleoside-diphosphate-sugar epimerase
VRRFLITGGNGFIGTVLTDELLKRGDEVWSLSRHPPKQKSGFHTPMRGDILEPNLSIFGPAPQFDAVYHLAGIHTLKTEDNDGAIWNTNVNGTHNVLKYCAEHNVKHLFFTSTAYAWSANPYGRSKMLNDLEVENFCRASGIKYTIYKPSVVMGTADHPYPGHFSQFMAAVIRVHQRAEIIRQKIEGTLRLPVIEPAFRVRGNPKGYLNLVPIDQVVKGICEIDKEGIVWLTNPNPPTLEELADWAGEYMMLNFKIMPEFKAMPLEALFAQKAAAFIPYMEGDNFPSDLPECPKITKEFIQQTIRALVTMHGAKNGSASDV